MLFQNHTNLLLQNGFTIGVIALQRPRPVIHAFPVSTPYKKRFRGSDQQTMTFLERLMVLSNTCWPQPVCLLCVSCQTLNSAESMLVQDLSRGNVTFAKPKHACNVFRAHFERCYLSYMQHTNSATFLIHSRACKASYSWRFICHIFRNLLAALNFALNFSFHTSLPRIQRAFISSLLENDGADTQWLYMCGVSSVQCHHGSYCKSSFRFLCWQNAHCMKTDIRNNYLIYSQTLKIIYRALYLFCYFTGYLLDNHVTGQACRVYYVFNFKSLHSN